MDENSQNRHGEAFLNSKYIFAVLFTILTLSIVATVYLYAGSQFQDQVLDLKVQLGTANEKVNDLKQQNSNLQQQLAQAKEQKPYLVTRPGWYLHPDRLYIGGEVTNVGAKTAQNCRLHVTLYRNETIVKDAQLEIGTLEAWSHTSVFENVYYAGSLLTNWVITPEWDD